MKFYFRREESEESEERVKKSKKEKRKRSEDSSASPERVNYSDISSVGIGHVGGHRSSEFGTWNRLISNCIFRKKQKKPKRKKRQRNLKSQRRERNLKRRKAQGRIIFRVFLGFYLYIQRGRIEWRRIIWRGNFWRRRVFRGGRRSFFKLGRRGNKIEEI